MIISFMTRAILLIFSLFGMVGGFGVSELNVGLAVLSDFRQTFLSIEHDLLALLKSLFCHLSIPALAILSICFFMDGQVT